MVIRFWPDRLGAKPDCLTRRWDVYLKEEGNGYASVNSHNYKPIFTSTRLKASLRASSVIEPVLREVSSFDAEQLYQDILHALPSDSFASELRSKPLPTRWSEDPNGLLLHDSKVYVPDVDDL